MGLFDDRTRFVQNGAEYEHADPRPELPPKSLRRFVYGGEAQAVAQVPLKGGRTVEIHGYATHYNQDWVNVAWTDDTFQHLTCWVPSPEGECRASTCSSETSVFVASASRAFGVVG